MNVRLERLGNGTLDTLVGPTPEQDKSTINLLNINVPLWLRQDYQRELDTVISEVLMTYKLENYAGKSLVGSVLVLSPYQNEGVLKKVKVNHEVVINNEGTNGEFELREVTGENVQKKVLKNVPKQLSSVQEYNSKEINLYVKDGRSEPLPIKLVILLNNNNLFGEYGLALYHSLDISYKIKATHIDLTKN